MSDVATQAPNDVAPGDKAADESGSRAGLTGYAIGFAIAVALTFASFWVASSNPLWGPALPIALVTLAIAQMGVHLVFFLHLTSGPDSANNALALAFGVLIVFLVFVGSIWIMAHLNRNMPPMAAVMSMQR